MKIQVLGCCGGRLPGFYTSGFLLNDHLLLDAGEIGGVLKIEDQCQISDILLTHAHLDHVVGLPFLGDTIFGQIHKSISIISIQDVLDSLHRHVFNDQIWPDFTRLPGQHGQPVFRLQPLRPGLPCSIAEFEVISFPVRHTVPTAGYLIRDQETAILYSGDTGSLQDIIQAIRSAEKLKAAFIETSFPNRLKKLAEETGHLIPAALSTLLAELDPQIQVWLFGMKPQYLEEIAKECQEFQDRARILRQGEILHLT
ncbi:MAG: 3',5'-cyclic-nucleotide phosphodiesterase [bacterium]